MLAGGLAANLLPLLPLPSVTPMAYRPIHCIHSPQTSAGPPRSSIGQCRFNTDSNRHTSLVSSSHMSVLHQTARDSNCTALSVAILGMPAAARPAGRRQARVLRGRWESATERWAGLGGLVGRAAPRAPHRLLLAGNQCTVYGRGSSRPDRHRPATPRTWTFHA